MGVLHSTGTTKVAGQPYIDIDVRVPAGTLIEQLRVKGNDPFYRLRPLAGTHINVVIVGTNIPKSTIEESREFASEHKPQIQRPRNKMPDRDREGG